jgi:dihydrofolate synthase/folylpolyglutamate synthase
MSDVYDYLLGLGKNWDAAPYTFGLEAFRDLCAAFGNPHEGMNFVHVAGTNGKGSVAWILAQSLEKAGFKTGLYTSPHLLDFTERIRINGAPIPAREWEYHAKSRRTALETLRPSFFESATAIAFAAFREHQTDIIVLETGLGGRLDATNVVTPLVSVITNVGHDHMELLGTKLEQIAAEKAGIVKPGVPVVVGEKRPELIEVFAARARDVGAPMHACDVEVRPLHLRPGAMRFAVYRQDRLLAQSQTNLWGLHQCDNLAVAWKTLEVLNERPNSFDSIGKTERPNLILTAENVGLRARMEFFDRRPPTIVDGAHNPEGTAALFSALDAAGIQNPTVLWGGLADKDLAAIASHFPMRARYFFTAPPSPRAAPANAWRPWTQNLNADYFDHPNEALVAAEVHALHNGNTLVVAGSLYLAAFALKLFDTER